jgi:hypothetical protein
MNGTVVDVQVFTRDGVERDKRAQQIQEQELERVRKDFADQQRIMENDTFQRVERMLVGKVADGGPANLKPGSKITKAYLQEITERGPDRWFEIRLRARRPPCSSRPSPTRSSSSARSSGIATRPRSARSPAATTWPPACSRWSRSMWR